MRSLIRVGSAVACLLPLVGLLGCTTPAGTGEPVGARSLPVLGGRAATMDERFGTVAIMTSVDGEEECTGTLIAPDLVLSAAHCVVNENEATGEVLGQLEPKELFVVAGLLDAQDSPPEARYAVRKLVYDEGYPGTTDENDPEGLGKNDDLSLLLLERAVVGLDPVPVLAMDRVDATIAVDTPLTVAGYGDRDLNSEFYGQLYLAETPFVRRNDSEFIAGRVGTPDTCPGDSGGPVYVSVDGAMHLVGATSRGTDTSTKNCGEGGIYTLVPAYEEWLIANSEGAYPPDFGTGAGGGGGGSAGSGGAEDTGEDADEAAGDSGGCSVGGAGESSTGSSGIAMSLGLAAAALVARRRVLR